MFPIKSTNSKPNFTKDQQLAIDEILSFINSPYDVSNIKRALIGAAGTGKTFCLKYIINNCGYSHSNIGLAAPTHKACRVMSEATGLKANTLQSDLGLRLNFDVDNFDINNPPFDPKGSIKIDDYRVYVIDEASMINRGLKTLIERECLKRRCKILYVGRRNCRL